LLPDELAAWPTVDPASIKDLKDRARFNHLDRAATIYANGGGLREAAQAARLDETWVCKLITKARGIAPDGQLWGYRAFVRGAARKKYLRDAALDNAAVPPASE
jgi:hypothetical protein